MQSQLVPGRFRPPAEVQRLGDHALTAGLCIYAGLYLCLLGYLAFGFYAVLQPTRYANPGVPANPDRPARPYVSAYGFPSNGTNAFASAIESGAKAKREVSDQPNKPKKPDNITMSLKRTRTVHPAQSKRHDPRMDYAAQPAFGDYRPWGSYQTWSGYRPSGNYQASGGYRPWNSYQGGGYRNGR
jgi:hypothetical protein